MAKTRSMCRGCRDDFYNQNRPRGCWSFENAKIVQRVQVGTWEPPPYRQSPVRVLSCCHLQGYSMLDLDDCRLARNWKAAVAAGGTDE